MSSDVAEEIRCWRQARRTSTGLPLVFAAPQRIAVDDREVVVVRRRSPRLGERGRARACGFVGQ